MLRKPLRIIAGLLVVGVVGAAVATSLAPDRVAEIAIPDPIDRDLADIVQRDTLVALTSYNSTSYFCTAASRWATSTSCCATSPRRPSWSW